MPINEENTIPTPKPAINRIIINKERLSINGVIKVDIAIGIDAAEAVFQNPNFLSKMGDIKVPTNDARVENETTLPTIESVKPNPFK